MLAKAKGVHREVESEGRRRQSPAPTNRNHIRQFMGVRSQVRLKPNSFKVANTSNKYWRAVNGATVKAAITNDRLRQAGYTFFSDYYLNARA